MLVLLLEVVEIKLFRLENLDLLLLSKILLRVQVAIKRLAQMIEEDQTYQALLVLKHMRNYIPVRFHLSHVVYYQLNLII